MAEADRLKKDQSRSSNWKRWGPYLSERQWGTVREDYSADGACWEYFPHDHARSRAYRWGEDGLLGITDRQCRLCVGVALWNGKDPILKERLFGLTGPQGNHGEDVKECYYYLDSTPTHSYMKVLYKYPQTEYPYSQLVTVNGERDVHSPEYELEDTKAFAESRYWDVFAEYAKASPNDVLCKYTVCNRGPETATVHVIPTVWYRNTWSWGCRHEGCTMRPRMRKVDKGKVSGRHESLGVTFWEVDKDPQGQDPELWFTENETNTKKLYNWDGDTKYSRDAFHRYLIDGETAAINPKSVGTKVGAHFKLTVPPGGSVSVRCRLYHEAEAPGQCFGKAAFDEVFRLRKVEADVFYSKIIKNASPDDRLVARQAYAGLLWSKQFYHYIIKDWIQGDPDTPKPPEERQEGRNHDWMHLFNRDVISMPDKWEYPWYASWDLAFHMIPFAEIDIDFAKDQLTLFLREWYMHPNGQIPAYEFAFDDVNPPVHALAVMEVWRLTGPRGRRDNAFLARCFQKLLLNFTWWVNRKDPEGKNIFAGGFLGLDNIGLFDRSKPLPTGGYLQQADGTAWMAFYAIIMLNISLELALTDPVYEDMASKFFEHFIAIVDAMNQQGGQGLWNEEDGFYYDHLKLPDGQSRPLRIRSLVGLVPLFSCLVLEKSSIQKLPGFYKRTMWFLENRKDLANRITFMDCENDQRFMLAIPTKDQLVRVLQSMLDEDEFLSPYGIRSLSKYHAEHPFEMDVGGENYRVQYTPGESDTYLFGGNSNWRGPIWLCMNFLIMTVLKRYHYFYGDDVTLECPQGSGRRMNLKEVSDELSRRMTRLFQADPRGNRPCHGGAPQYAENEHWKDLVLFYEYFHGDSGRGLGASHQTGWTAVVASCLRQLAMEEQGGAAGEGGATAKQ